jgi:nitroimidazol reductase NimA-like FMN-containing flavoprotein (pyridoxamine 5'-phosphate oxidase superfamily)
MSRTSPSSRLDPRFGEADAPTPWSETEAVLAAAELYWLTTIRSDGRPHTTPLVGVWAEQAFAFCTGPTEQKARNLGANPHVTVTTGCNAWQAGHDVVIEGRVERVTGGARLQAVADAYREKYGSAWDFEHDEEVFSPDEGPAAVFAVRPAKVLSFAKSPHAQTAYRFG